MTVLRSGESALAIAARRVAEEIERTAENGDETAYAAHGSSPVMED
jgi:hypothetical protein